MKTWKSITLFGLYFISIWTQRIFNVCCMFLHKHPFAGTYRWLTHKALAISRLARVHISSNSSTSECHHHYYTAIEASKLGLPLFVNLQLLHVLFTPKPPSTPPPHSPHPLHHPPQGCWWITENSVFNFQQTISLTRLQAGGENE